jgi:transcriptional regulator with XRE-family HTH domain
MTEKNIGDRLREVRKTLQLNQDAVAQKLHVTIQTLSRYENNTRFPDSVFLQEFGRAFRINAIWLLYGRGYMFLRDPEMLHLLEDEQMMLRYLFGKIEEIITQLNK